jgi:hypothetical protein
VSALEDSTTSLRTAGSHRAVSCTLSRLTRQWSGRALTWQGTARRRAPHRGEGSDDCERQDVRPPLIAGPLDRGGLEERHCRFSEAEVRSRAVVGREVASVSRGAPPTGRARNRGPRAGTSDRVVGSRRQGPVPSGGPRAPAVRLEAVGQLAPVVRGPAARHQSGREPPGRARARADEARFGSLGAGPPSSRPGLTRGCCWRALPPG